MEDVQQLGTAGPQGAGFPGRQMGTLLRKISAEFREKASAQSPDAVREEVTSKLWGGLVTQGCGEMGVMRVCIRVGMYVCRALGVEETVSLTSSACPTTQTGWMPEVN